MAMAMMGYGGKGGPQDRELEAQKQAWEEKYQAGQLSLDELRQKAAEGEYKSLAEARSAATSEAAQKRMDEATRETTRQKELAESLTRARELEGRTTAKGLLDTMVKEGRIAVGTPEYNRLAERSMPGYGAESEQIAQADREKAVTGGLAKYQQADPKAKAQYAKDPATMGAGITPEIYGEILKRANVNVAQPGAPAAVSSGSGGLSGGIPDVLWNLPGGVENIFRYGANLGSKAWYGKDAPQYEYMPWTHAADEWAKGGPEVAPAPAGSTPQPQYGNYGQPVADVSVPPEWQYGVGQQRPPPALNDLLAKALQNQ
jgi:hypothetical protein